MSDMTGNKPTAFHRFCKKKKLGYLRFEYSGHGKSSDEFVNGNISKWTDDARQLIKAKIKKNKKLIFIGSSMGSWIALNIAKNFKSQLKAFIGIASAPEFTEKLMWKKFPKKIKKILNEKKIVEIKNDYGSTYPITKNLIDNGRKNKIFSKLKLNLPSVLFHGTNDKSVPLIFSSKTLKLFRSLNKKIIKIKNGDHSLSRKSDIKKILKELTRLVNEI
tara:strand:- start:11 stop:664 length:654 start_codon:yes stop_codon:yes gene_type:complete